MTQSMPAGEPEPGASRPPSDVPPSSSQSKVLRRSVDDRMLGGVCGGIAAYFGVDSTVVRLLFVVLAIAGGATIIAYLVLWIVVPEADADDNVGPGPRPMDLDVEPQQGWQVVGVILLAIGAVMLASRVLPGFLDELLWPIALVVLGGALLLHGGTRR